jgi:hypothetical protein
MEIKYCPVCGHFEHLPGPCGWHAGTCEEAESDKTLMCMCDGNHPDPRLIQKDYAVRCPTCGAPFIISRIVNKQMSQK